MASLLERFRTHVRAARLFPRPGAALVAVSGGPDSIALLDLMQGVAAELGLTLVVAHADHQIRADSGAVAAAVRDAAETRGLSFELGELGLGPTTTETAARSARQAWLRALRRRRDARYIVLGHTRDDQVETILMRVLRGSAPAGLAAMAARARGGLIRPLLSFSKAELAAHAAQCGLVTHDDPANRDPRHLRSWVRTALLPLLEARLGPGLRDDVLRVGDAAALERRAWERMLEHLPELRLRRVRSGFDVAREAVRGYDDRGRAARRARARPPCCARRGGARRAPVGPAPRARRWLDGGSRLRRTAHPARRDRSGEPVCRDGGARPRGVRRVSDGVGPGERAGGAAAARVDDLDRWRRLGGPAATARRPSDSRRGCGAPAAAAAADGSAGATERPGQLPRRDPRPNHSLGPRGLPER